jgi:hypothetical protein
MPFGRSLALSSASLVLVIGCSQPSAGTDSGAAADASGQAPRNHRVAVVDCSHDRAAGDAIADPGGDCATDADCTAGMNGRCLVTTVAARFNYCSYDACFADSDCSASEVCRCREAPNDANVCTLGNCAVDSDCGAGGYCSPSAAFDRINFGVAGYFCHTPGDECVDDEDCRVDGGNAECAWSADAGHWACSEMQFLPP